VTDFDRALSFTVPWECGNDPKNPRGNVDNPADHGGRTSRGITQTTYDGACDSYHWPRGDVWDAADAQVRTIYQRRFWDRLHGDLLHWPFSGALFDTAVLHRLPSIITGLQRIVGAPTDGLFGLDTMHAVARFGWVNSAWELLQGRDDRYEVIVHRDGTQRPFYGGWEARLDALTAFLALPKTLDAGPP
jgi:lysozyme family protein